jgi:exopolysaccharide biosynthesis protein
MVGGLAAAAFLAVADANATTMTVDPWTPLYRGIEMTTASFSASVYAMRVDLTAPGMGFTATPHSGPLETTAQTTSQFLESSGAQVAINANFFDPCCNAVPEPKNLKELAVSTGTLVSPPSVYPDAGSAVLLLTKQNQATITTVTSTPIDLSNVFNAVAGSTEIVTNGLHTASNNPPSVGDPLGVNPRTDTGISADGKYLYLAVIDGRQPGYSGGVTTSDAADLMIALGSYEAVNLDGGGSTALVRSDGEGGAIVVNRPGGGAERYDGNNFGVFATPFRLQSPALPGWSRRR